MSWITQVRAVDGSAQVIRQGLSIGVATGAYGISFGALAIAAGLDFWQAMALSLLMFTGGSQFAFVGVLSAGGNPISAVATAVFLGIRNGLYGMQLAPILESKGARSALAAHVTIDESSAVALSQPQQRLAQIGFWATGIAVFVLWNLATALGALLGDALGDPRAWGLDAAAAAAFLGLLWPRLRSRESQAVAVAAAFLAIVLIPAVPAGIPVLAAVLVAVIAGWKERA